MKVHSKPKVITAERRRFHRVPSIDYDPVLALPGLFPARPIRVLVVDESTQILKALSDFLTGPDSLKMLNESSLTLVGAVTNADEAIRLAKLFRPDVILIDLHMPGGGIHTLAQLKRLAPKSKVIALADNVDQTEVTEMLRLGAIGYLVKGIAGAKLVDAIHQAVRGETPLSPEITPVVVEELRRQLSQDHEENQTLVGRAARTQQALGKDGFQVVFQPIFQLVPKATVGFEALVRFAAPPTKPPEFWFAEAHAIGQGVELELTTIRAALDYLPNLQVQDFLCLNLGPDSILSGELPAVFYDKDLSRVVLELTEHAPIWDYEALSHELKPLRDLGLRLSIDDAGAGFASLRHILKLEPDFIKLDISLIHGIDSQRPQRALARGLITFGAEIGATLIGEGIETANELATLIELGVGIGQGFYLGRPGPLPETM